MAPPRRSVARNATATPARSTRGTSALPPESPPARRSARGTTKKQAPSEGIITNPNLPEVQTQQSYAYGSTKTPLLPDQLVANERMTLQQITSKLDEGMRQAEQHFEDYAAETKANFTDSRAERAKKRASRETSQESSREGSVDSETRKTRRTAAWASSLESSQLENISEEESLREETPGDEETRRGTDPSSFPSGIFDHSYNYERGTRGPLASPTTSPNFFLSFFSNLGHSLSNGLWKAYLFLESIILTIGDITIRIGQNIWNSLIHLFEWMSSPRFLQLVIGLALGAFVIMFCLTSFCKLYTGYLCNPDSTSTLHLTLQEYCGRCSVATALPTNLTFEERKDIAKMTKAINALTQKIQEAEARMDSKFDVKHADLIYSLEDLEKQQRHLQSKIANIETRQTPTSDYSPLMQKINYFAPGTGALVNPYRTSPTKQKKFPSFAQRAFLGAFGIHRYTSNPPSSALEPWEDVGDCWCASDGDGQARLGVDLGHSIYPTEIVIEHYPSAGSITPDTTPRRIEIWAEFSHLTPEQWADSGVSGLQGIDPISPTMGKIGEAVYEATSRNHVQTFRLDVNQGALVHHTEKVTVRVVGNYGAEYTCLYRVRLHGVAVVPHATLKL